MNCGAISSARASTSAGARVHTAMRSTDRNRFRKDAEAGFPIKVEIRVPA